MRRDFCVGFLLCWFVVLAPARLAATTYHTIAIDGRTGDFSPDELVVNDPIGDSFWNVPPNEIDNLYLTWDSLNLYVGCDYVVSGNALIIYLDAGADQGLGILNADRLDWYPRDFRFRGARPEFLIALWDANYSSGGVRKIQSDGKTQTIPATAANTAAHDTAGSIEVSLPWPSLYGRDPGEVSTGAVLQIVAVIAGGDHYSGPDAAPDNESVRGGGTANLRSFFKIVVDADSNGVPDVGTRPSIDGHIEVYPKVTLKVEDLTLSPQVLAPMHSSLDISFRSTDYGEATVRVFSEDGEIVGLVAQQVEVQKNTISHFTWEGRDASGNILPAGIYVVTVDVDQQVVAKEALALIK